jgi:DNA-binding transcriptional MerR regulator
MEKPKMMTIRQVAATGVLSEYTLRLLEKQGKLPCLYSGRRCLVNYDRLLEQLNHLGCFDDIKQ